MLIHNAVFWLRKDLTSEERARFDTEVRQLAQLSYLDRGFSGTPAETESRPVVDHSFDYATSLHFKSLEDHQFYLNECKGHARFVTVCKPLWEHVVIYDIALVI